LTGNFAYVADGYNGFLIINKSDPSNPALRGSYGTFGYSAGVAVDGDYAYVADYFDGLLIINKSNPAEPL